MSDDPSEDADGALFSAPPPVPEGPGPFDLRHQEIVGQLGMAQHIPREHEYRQLLYGPPGRRVKHPLMAIMHEKELGACRHALAQRTVAGTMEIVMPWGPDSLHAPKKPKKPKKTES